MNHIIKAEFLDGKFLAGPDEPKDIRRDGYRFTEDPSEAWAFASEKQALAKRKVIARHFDTIDEEFEVLPG